MENADHLKLSISIQLGHTVKTCAEPPWQKKWRRKHVTDLRIARERCSPAADVDEFVST